VNTVSERLLEQARQAARRAHAPYSHFRVGAAVLGENDEIVVGCNVESASYGLSCCAERVALFAAVAAGIRPVRLAVSCLDAPASAPASSRTPCGACRQVALDLMGPAGIIDIDGVGTFTVDELLPDGFSL
jgi:cytidine deaminase